MVEIMISLFAIMIAIAIVKEIVLLPLIRIAKTMKPAHSAYMVQINYYCEDGKMIEQVDWRQLTQKERIALAKLQDQKRRALLANPNRRALLANPKE